MPLRLASGIGFLLAILSFAYGVLVIIDHLFFEKSIPGWPTIIASNMFLSGVTLLFIGILGEYMARIYDEVKARPPYLVAEVSPPQDRGEVLEQLSIPKPNSAKMLE